MKNRGVQLFAASIMSCLLTACPHDGETVGPVVPPPTAAPAPQPTAVPDAIGAKLKDSDFKKYSGPFSDRTPAPGISSYRQDPISALGSIFAKVAKKDKTCSSTNVADFEFLRLGEERPVACQAKAYPPSVVTQMLVNGGTASDIDYIIGKANIKAEYAYEFTVSEPVTAVLTDTSKCVSDAKIANMPLPDQTCDLKYVAGIVVTQVSYRKFTKLEGEASVSYVVKIAGKAYGGSEDLTHQWFLTVDTLDLSRFFERNAATAFLAKRKDQAAVVLDTPIPKTPDEVLKLPQDRGSKTILDWNLAKNKNTTIEPMSEARIKDLGARSRLMDL